MRTSSPKSPSAPRRLACYALSLFVLASLLLLPQAQHALSMTVRPVHAATRLLRPATHLSARDTNFWHTDGSRILDAHNRPVRIAGMNWSGFETKEAVPGGLEVQDYRSILRLIKQNGYNTVRIPFSNEMVEMPAVPEHIAFRNAAGAINAELHDRTSLEILDEIVAYAGDIGLKVILDNHRSEAGSSAEESGLWYSERFPETAWIEDWTSLARRYQGNATVIGMDLRNEPHNAGKGGSCWDCGGQNDWHKAAERAGNAILNVNPRLLIFVEGVDTYAGDSYWWGGNLEGVKHSPVHLSMPNRLVYSAHEYGPTEYAQPWFNRETSPASLSSMWRRHWAYISESGMAPVWIGEFGAPNGDADIRSPLPGSEGQWFSTLVDFLGSHPLLGWTYWGVNGEDRYGLLDSTYMQGSANPLKTAALAAIAGLSPKPSVARDLPSASSTSEDAMDAPEISGQANASLQNAEVARKRSFKNGFAHDGVSASWSTSPPADLLRNGRTDPAKVSLQNAIAMNVHKATRVANERFSNRPEAANTDLR